MIDEEGNRHERVEGPQNERVVGDVDQSGDSQRHEPDRSDRSKDTRDLTGAKALN